MKGGTPRGRRRVSPVTPTNRPLQARIPGASSPVNRATARPCVAIGGALSVCARGSPGLEDAPGDSFRYAKKSVQKKGLIGEVAEESLKHRRSNVRSPA
jgi:hypothetical protein